MSHIVSCLCFHILWSLSVFALSHIPQQSGVPQYRWSFSVVVFVPVCRWHCLFLMCGCICRLNFFFTHFYIPHLLICCDTASLIAGSVGNSLNLIVLSHLGHIYLLRLFSVNCVTSSKPLVNLSTLSFTLRIFMVWFV